MTTGEIQPRFQAIETLYRGYRFRSRLEARWAVFLDALGIPYEYEREGFDVDGEWYLPDFWLPRQEHWLEIKPHEATMREWHKPWHFAWTGRQNIAVLMGPPGLNMAKGTPLGTPAYCGVFFVGDHTRISDWRYLETVCGCSSFQSLSDFLAFRASEGQWLSGDVPTYNGTEDSARQLIEVDRLYYQNRYGREHSRWLFGNSFAPVGWNRIGEHPFTLEPLLVGWVGEIALAYNAARQARFD